MSCTPRIQPLPAAEIRIAGTPTIAIRTHGKAAPVISLRAANTDTSGTATIWTTTTISVPKPSASQVACTPSPTADARSPAPKKRAERAVVPYDKKVIFELSVARISPPMARPASGNAPNRPTIAMSKSR